MHPTGMLSCFVLVTNCEIEAKIDKFGASI